MAIGPEFPLEDSQSPVTVIPSKLITAFIFLDSPSSSTVPVIWFPSAEKSTSIVFYLSDLSRHFIDLGEVFLGKEMKYVYDVDLCV